MREKEEGRGCKRGEDEGRWENAREAKGERYLRVCKKEKAEREREREKSGERERGR